MPQTLDKFYILFGLPSLFSLLPSVFFLPVSFFSLIVLFFGSSILSRFFEAKKVHKTTPIETIDLDAVSEVIHKARPSREDIYIYRLRWIQWIELYKTKYGLYESKNIKKTIHPSRKGLQNPRQGSHLIINLDAFHSFTFSICTIRFSSSSSSSSLLLYY